MHVSRRRFLQTTRATAVGVGATALAGCSSFTEPTQLLTVANETDDDHTITITVLNAASETTSAPANETTGTSTRFVVDFEYDVGAGSRREAPNVLPKSGTFEVVATVDDLGTARTTYTDTESVRVKITDAGVSVSTYAP